MRQLLVPRSAATFSRPLTGFGDFDRLFDEFWGAPRRQTGSAAPSTLAPRMDYSVTDEEIRIRAEMPGLEEKDIEVSLEEGVLTLKGSRTEQTEENDEKKGVHHVETYRGSFHRAVRLPAEVDADRIVASYRNGILSVTLPVVPEAKPEVRTIPVTTS